MKKHFKENINFNKLRFFIGNIRDKYKNHEFYQDTLSFCENWDQASFDPNYKSLKLKDFEPMVKRIFSRKPYKN